MFFYKNDVKSRGVALRRSKSDPNGIRTRVTAVKGRCPRPLDDRVRKRAISEARRSVASYLGRINRSVRLLARGYKRAEKLRGPLCGAAMRREHALCVRDQLLAAFAVAQ